MILWKLKVLDIGCGDGKYLLEVKAQGCECFGVDINKEALQRLHTIEPSITTYCGTLWAANFPKDFFDVVNLTDVLEHVPEIDTLLIEIRKIMKKDGVLRMKIPNSSSLTFKIFGKYWIGLDTPRHVQIFSIKNLKLLIKNMNYRICAYRTVENSFDFICSLLYMFNASFKKKLDVMALSSIWDNELLKLVFAPYAIAVNVLKIGDSVEFILKR